MGNAARNLHDLFVLWRERAGDAKSVAQSDIRLIRDPEQFRMEARQAFTWVVEVEDLIILGKAMQLDVSREEPFVEQWYHAVLGYPTNWNDGASPGRLVSDHAMDVLYGFGRYLDSTPQLAVQEPNLAVSEDERATLADALPQIAELLKSDTSVSRSLRHYMARLVREMQIALDDETFNATFNLHEAANRLWFTLFAAEAQSSNEHSGVWTQMRESGPWVRDTVTGAAGQLLGGFAAGFLGLPFAG